MKFLVFILAFMFVYNAFAQSTVCSRVKRMDQQHRAWKLNLRNLQTNPNLSFAEKLRESKRLALVAENNLRVVMGVQSSLSDDVASDQRSLQTFLAREKRGDYRPDFVLSFLTHALPRAEHALTNGLFNRELQYCYRNPSPARNAPTRR